MVSTTDQQPDLAARFLSLAVQLMLSLGYPGLAVLIVVEQLIPPIPSTLILPLAGILASQGAWSLPGVIIAGTVGSLVSALIFNALGRWLDQAVLGRLLNRYRRWLDLDAARFEQVMRQFDRHGPLLVAVGLSRRARATIAAGLPLSSFSLRARPRSQNVGLVATPNVDDRL